MIVAEHVAADKENKAYRLTVGTYTNVWVW